MVGKKQLSARDLYKEEENSSRDQGGPSIGRDKSRDRDRPKKTVFLIRLCVLYDLRQKDIGGGQVLYNQGRCLSSEEPP